jgi:phage-related protein
MRNSHSITQHAVLVAFQKTTRQTPKHVIETCRRRLRRYDDLTQGG